MESDYISIGKIMNFFGIKGEAKIGFSNINQIKQAKTVYMLDDPSRQTLEIQSVRFLTSKTSKNFAIVKFKDIDDINSLVQFKGQRIFMSKKDVLKKLSKDEFLINDLIGCEVYNTSNQKIGEVAGVSSNSAQDILNIKNLIGKVDMVPFVGEFFPEVDVQNKKIIIKPIEGLLS